MNGNIENTTKRDPLLHFAGALGGMDDYVTGMESAGQRQLVHSDRLPTDIGSNTVEEFEALGFTLGDPDPQDPMFRPATLPDGWQREGSDHAMWSYILDPNGRRRVAIFYKAAFYDRSAFMRISTIYSELTGVVWGDDEPVIDEWTTREDWIAALRAQAEDDRAKEREFKDHASGLSESAAARAAKCESFLAKLAGA
jgi:hypothetical protein